MNVQRTASAAFTAEFENAPCWQASGFYRGFAKEGVDLRGMSRVYSGTHYAVVLKRATRSWIVAKFYEGNPDLPSPLPAADQLLRTLRRR